MNLSFSDTELQSVSAMIDNAEGTSIDLGNAQLDQFPKLGFERRFFQMNFNVVKILQRWAEQSIHVRLFQSRRTCSYCGHSIEYNPTIVQVARALRRPRRRHLTYRNYRPFFGSRTLARKNHAEAEAMR